VTYAPQSLRELMRYWVEQGGVNLGIVGDTAHQQKGISYHLGRDQLTAYAYSRVTARDKAGLTNAASAVDLGRLNGSLTKLRDFSGWLVTRCQANAPGTSDIREVIYTLDGSTVLRYDRQRGYASKPREGEADKSHLTHTHISFYRDSEHRSKTDLFIPYFVELPDTDTEGDMPGLDTTPGSNLISGVARPKEGTEVIRVSDRERITIPQDVVREAVGPFISTDLKLPGYFISISGSTCWVRSSQANFTPDGLPTTVRTELTLDGRKYVGNVTAV
jgi:hypothetical protein